MTDKIKRHLTILLMLSMYAVDAVYAQNLTHRQIADLESQITVEQEAMELRKTGPAPSAPRNHWMLRSKHFAFGHPRLLDDRHNYTPEGHSAKRTGVSVLVREGFVIGHIDRMRSPLWVTQRWTKADYHRMNKVASQDRRWKSDFELPKYARAGTSYDGNQTQMDRGHMARHAMNRAWGIDSSNSGCFMSNSTPQHKRVNRGDGWRQLEDDVRDIVMSEEFDIDAVWTISGAIFRDNDNPTSEMPEEDFKKVKFIGDGYGVPFATYKIVGWFDDRGWFQARGYVFEQSDRMKDPESYLTAIDEIEQRTGVDFFAKLRDDIEDKIEGANYEDMWGAE